MGGARRRIRAVVIGFGAASVCLAVWGGVAAAVSAGGYEPDQQDCPWNSSAQDAGAATGSASGSNTYPQSGNEQTSTPPPANYAGCHNLAVNVESASTTNGNPDSANTRYVELGNDQAPNNTATQQEGYKSFGALLYLGDPGSSRSIHSGCLAANTDGTTGGTGAQPGGTTSQTQGGGCGTNPSGTGFEQNYDDSFLYCGLADPVFGATGGSSDPTGIVSAFNQANGFVFLPIAYTCDPSLNQQLPSAPTVTTGTSTDGIMAAVKQGLLLYFGMDDNTDNGEHDGFTGIDGPCYDAQNNTTYYCHSAGAVNGASDGGGMQFGATPAQGAAATQSEAQRVSAAAAAGDPYGFVKAITSWIDAAQTNPEGILNYSMGFCADSYCGEATTQQQTVYYGCYAAGNPNTSGYWDNPANTNNKTDAACQSGTPESSNVYENDAPTQQSKYGDFCGSDAITQESGNSQSSCNGTPNSNRQNTPQQMNAEPGVQIYHDPDGQGAGANETDTTNIGGTGLGGSGLNSPSAYAGTCGVYYNNGGGDRYANGSPDPYNNVRDLGTSAAPGTPLAASNGEGGYLVDGNNVPGSQCGEN